MDEMMLDCVVCGCRKWLAVEPPQAEELRLTGATRVACSVCKRETFWKVSDYDRRVLGDRRAYVDRPKPQTVEIIPGSEGIALNAPPDKQFYRQAAAAMVTSERRDNMDRRQSVQRTNGRVSLCVPIRVRDRSYDIHFEDRTTTDNVSRTGLYFENTHPYRKGILASVCLYYSHTNPHANINQQGTVVRVDMHSPSPASGVAIQLN